MDIDIDVPATIKPDFIKNSIRASIIQGGKLVPHPCGVYFQKIPIDEVTGLAAIPYKEAEIFGFQKIDILHNNIYNNIKSRQHLEQLLNQEPRWELFQVSSIVKQLFQLSNHLDVLQRVKPKSILELADVLALIRPGKRFALDAYCAEKEKVRPLLYMKDDDSYSFKKSHAIAYALVVIVQLNLICNGEFDANL
jgi:DNA polymerase III alpha subunit